MKLYLPRSEEIYYAMSQLRDNVLYRDWKVKWKCRIVEPGGGGQNERQHSNKNHITIENTFCVCVRDEPLCERNSVFFILERVILRNDSFLLAEW